MAHLKTEYLSKITENKSRYIPVGIVVIGYFVMAPFLSFAYDESFYFQYFRWTFLYNVQPYFLWVFGTFYNSINIGFLSLNIPFYFFGFDNVLVQQFTQKLPLIISSLLVGYGITLIIKHLKPQKNLFLTPMLLFMTLPITIFDVEFMSNPLIISIMFLTLSLVFFTRKKPIISSVLMGAAASTYLYPIFFILPLIKIINKDFGRKNSIKAALLFLATLSLGQLLPVIISVITNTPIATTVLAPLFGHISSITVTSSSISLYGPYSFLYKLFGIRLSSVVLELVFFVLMSLPVFIFLFKKREKISFENFINFIFLDSLIFVVFSVTAEPQYLLAIAPFSIILFYQKERPFYFTILNGIFIIYLIFFFTQNPIMSFFSNVHPAWAYSYRLNLPSIVLLSLSFLLVALFFIYAVFHLYAIKEHIVKNSIQHQLDTRFKKYRNALISEHLARKGFSLFICLMVITLIIAVPIANNPPNLMIFTSQASSSSTEATYNGTSQNLSKFFIESPIVPRSLSNEYTKEFGSCSLNIPEGLITNLTETSLIYTVTNVSKNMSVTVTSSANPISVNQEVTFYSNVTGGVPPYSFQWYGGGNVHTQNETTKFHSLQNWSVELVVTDSIGDKSVVSYTEQVGYYSYGIFVNGQKIGNFNSHVSHTIPIESLHIGKLNCLEFGDNFLPSGAIRIVFKLPLNVPPQLILENPVYLFIGLFDFGISLVGLLWVVKFLRTHND